MSQEQGGYHVSQLFNLLSSTMSSIEEKRTDSTGVIALLSLFNLFSILALVQGAGAAVQGSVPGELGLSGTGDLAGTLSNVLAGGGKVGPEMLLGLLQKQGKKINPQLLASLLSLVGESGKGMELGGGESKKPKQETPPEKRQGRGIL